MNKKASIYFIFATIMLDMVGIGLIIPTLPDVMKRFVSSPDQLSGYFGYFISIYALMQFLASPLLGALSDLWGRRPLLLISVSVAAIDYLIMAFAPSLEILFLGRIIAGLTGASITVAMAYIADISTEENRSMNFGMVGAAFGLGFIIGPAIGGLIGGAWGPEYPFILAAALNGVNFLFGLFVLPESLPVDQRQKFQWQKLNPLVSLKKVLSNDQLLSLMIVIFFIQLAGQTHPSIWTLYTKQRYQWSSKEVGFSLAVLGLLMAFSQGYLTRVLIPKFGELKTVRWGLLGQSFTFALYGFATQGWMMYAILAVSSVFSIVPPALQSLVSKQASAKEQGELQGSIVSLSSLAAIITPILVTQLFASYGSLESHPYIPGAPYFFASLICFVGWFLFFRASKKTNF